MQSEDALFQTRLTPTGALENGTCAWATLVHVCEDMLPSISIHTGTAFSLLEPTHQRSAFLKNAAVCRSIGKTPNTSLQPLRTEDLDEIFCYYLHLESLKSDEVGAIIYSTMLVRLVGRARIRFTFLKNFILEWSQGG